MRTTFLAALTMLAASVSGAARAAGQGAADSAGAQQGLMTFRVAPVDGGALPADYVRRITEPLGALLATVDEYHAWQRDVFVVVHRDGTVRFEDILEDGDTVGAHLERQIGKAAALGLFAPFPAPFADSLAIGLGITHPAAERPVAGKREAYFEFQVEKTVRQLENFQRPEYPRELESGGIGGRVLVQFVVNVDGTADMSTFKVLEASHPAFAMAVREALPRMRFTAAEIGGQKVRQVVQQPFTFAPARPGTDASRNTIPRP